MPTMRFAEQLKRGAINQIESEHTGETYKLGGERDRCRTLSANIGRDYCLFDKISDVVMLSSQPRPRR
jgi:hypothetical protein